MRGGGVKSECERWRRKWWWGGERGWWVRSLKPWLSVCDMSLRRVRAEKRECVCVFVK